MLISETVSLGKVALSGYTLQNHNYFKYVLRYQYSQMLQLIDLINFQSRIWVVTERYVRSIRNFYPGMIWMYSRDE